MSVIEKAGGPLEALIQKKQKSAKPVKTPKRRFDLDLDKLASDGYYTPAEMASPLAMDLRAVKRRLLRRLGFLRSSGEPGAMRMPGRRRNVVLVTSAQAGEGKTFCALNLALSFALEDRISVALIDADMPRPKLRARLGLPAGPGFADCIADGLALSKAFVYARKGPLAVMGEGRPVEQSDALYASATCQKLLGDLSAGFRDGLVILDAPPTLAVSDAVILAKLVDEVVFVVEANETPEPAAAAALDELLDVNPHVSLILNRCLLNATGASYGSYDYYPRRPEASAEERNKSNGDV
ncbi:MAG: hypothetical protein AAFW81_09230 [Pseudomonadota bacterium]